MSEEKLAVAFTDIETAAQRIAGLVHRTPVLTSSRLNQHCAAELYFKCENLQKAGAFKARGATNAVYGLPETALAAGVATHSSGNHGAALAMAAAGRGVSAHIVMPKNSVKAKKEAVAAYGGTIIECDSNLPAREAMLKKVVAETGAGVVHPYNDPRVIAGQGTAMLELLEQIAELDVIVAPVGGGGLLAGVALAAKSLRPEIEVVGAEPAGADDAFRSFGLGRLIEQDNPQTIADGLRSSLGALNFPIIQRHVDTIVTVSEHSIVEAMQLQWSRLKTVSEPSGAVSFAAVLEHPERFRGRRVGVLVSGGNVDFDNLPW
jgi:threonine dehydratase